MPTKPRTLAARGARSKAERDREVDERRGSAAARGYDGTWRQARAGFLAEHPLCEYCRLEGLIAAATLVDHLYPHRTYAGVFWLTQWWVASCAPCHDGFKQVTERAGRRALDELAGRLGRPVLETGGGSKVRAAAA